MQLIIHRGTHEIGGSCVEIKTSSTRIIIDIGLPLVNERGEKFERSEVKDLSLDELLQKKSFPVYPDFILAIILKTIWMHFLYPIPI
jgi:ribonuclease J